MSAAMVVVLAYVLDRCFGEPPDWAHPVAWMGRLIAVGRDWALRAQRIGQLLRGAFVAIAIPALAAAIAWGLARAVGERAPVVTIAATALMLKPMFAVRALGDAAIAVRDALDRDDLDNARRGLGSLCSRKPDQLDAPGLIAATVESVAENASDSIVAPLLFFAVFGLPGAVFYRAVNTLDAMIGYHGRFEYVGKTAARLDDLLNLVPARVTAWLLLLGGAIASADVRQGVAMLRRDGARTESPNAGRPMAAMAGLLGVRLEKAGHYALGDPHEQLQTTHITRAVYIVSIASVAAVVVVSALGVVRG